MTRNRPVHRDRLIEDQYFYEPVLKFVSSRFWRLPQVAINNRSCIVNAIDLDMKGGRGAIVRKNNYDNIRR